MLSLPIKPTVLAGLFLFRNAGNAWLVAIIAGSALSIAAACLCYSLLLSRRLRARTRQLEQQVELRTRQAEEAHRIKSLFLTNMSHEIRTPMNGILGMASLLARTPVTKEQASYLETIRSCGDTLLTVINNILDFSAIESGKITLDEKVTDLRGCVEEVLEIFMARALHAGILLHCKLEEGVPARVLTDNGRLRQILINLVGNAVKFTRQGEILVRVFLTSNPLPADTTSDYTEIGFEVIDTGIGIETDQFDRLFHSFSQVDPSVTRQHGGNGLGLTISDRLVQLLNGRIRVESEPGKGSRFSFTILARPAPLKTAPATPATIPCLAEKYPLQILLAEDNPINRQLAVLILDKMGYTPGIAENGKEVLEQLQKEPFDLIFMDIQMPEMDGLEATRHIRAGHGRQPVIIAMTANTTRKDRDDCMNQGMNDFLSKPVHLEELIRMLESWGQKINSTHKLSRV
jgi:signal transduction histidine kinase/ActR/RegA family two-component response regulator